MLQIVRRGGWIFDAAGKYDIIWWAAVDLGVLSALLHLLMSDQPVERIEQQAA